MIDQLFFDIYHGRLPPRQASILMHSFCNAKGLNPAFETPLTMLMISEEGRRKLQLYETFFTQMNWLIAKLAAQTVEITLAVEKFSEGFAQLTEQVAREGLSEENNQDRRFEDYFRARNCPNCHTRHVY